MLAGMRRYLAPLTLFLLLTSGAASAGSLQLLVTHDAVCGDFARWQREIGPSYAATPEGRAAPLLEIQTDGPWPDGLALASRPRATPTFILVDDGREIGRIEGYGDAARFRAALSGMLQRGGGSAR